MFDFQKVQHRHFVGIVAIFGVYSLYFCLHFIYYSKLIFKCKVYIKNQFFIEKSGFRIL